jgi:16S rRNA U1498 N3-methylase RsmE
MDGQGTLYECVLTEISRGEAKAEIVNATPGWGAHSYNLTLAVCPTKNNERFEWFVEKAVELGVDRIVPLIGDHSERKIYKTDRAKRIALSAAKQSLKAAIPDIAEPVSVRDFIRSHAGADAPHGPAHGTADAPHGPAHGTADASHGPAHGTADASHDPTHGSAVSGLRMIAYCFDGERPRLSVKEALSSTTQPAMPPVAPGALPGTSADTQSISTDGRTDVTTGMQQDTSIDVRSDVTTSVQQDTSEISTPGIMQEHGALPDITILIGPEGDFSPEEAALALEAGFLPIHLGPSRLRTETAALAAVTAVYLHYLQ